MIRQHDSIVGDMGLQLKRFKHGSDVSNGGGRGWCAGKVRVEGEVAEVVGDGVVGGRV